MLTQDAALSTGTNKVVVWSYLINRTGLIYVIDIRNAAAYILRFDGPGAAKVSRIGLL